jgi:hypothetical protein
MLLMVLMESPSRMVRCSKYIGRMAGVGAPASATAFSIAIAAQATKTLETRRQFRMEIFNYSGCGTSTPV